VAETRAAQEETITTKGTTMLVLSKPLCLRGDADKPENERREVRAYTNGRKHILVKDCIELASIITGPVYRVPGLVWEQDASKLPRPYFMARIGNSVSPPVARALVEANLVATHDEVAT
jgi:hypothetical protein